jgi:hypothetical protein
VHPPRTRPRSTPPRSASVGGRECRFQTDSRDTGPAFTSPLLPSCVAFVYVHVLVVSLLGGLVQSP